MRASGPVSRSGFVWCSRPGLPGVRPDGPIGLRGFPVLVMTLLLHQEPEQIRYCRVPHSNSNRNKHKRPHKAPHMRVRGQVPENNNKTAGQSAAEPHTSHPKKQRVEVVVVVWVGGVWLCGCVGVCLGGGVCAVCRGSVRSCSRGGVLLWLLHDRWGGGVLASGLVVLPALGRRVSGCRLGDGRVCRVCWRTGFTGGLPRVCRWSAGGLPVVCRWPAGLPVVLRVYRWTARPAGGEPAVLALNLRCW